MSEDEAESLRAKLREANPVLRYADQEIMLKAVANIVREVMEPIRTRLDAIEAHLTEPADGGAL